MVMAYATFVASYSATIASVVMGTPWCSIQLVAVQQLLNCGDLVDTNSSHH